MTTPSRFLCVEVAIKTDADCDAFVDWFRAHDNHVEKLSWTTNRWHVYFAPLPCATADMTIRSICDGIPDWPQEVRRHWDEAAIREFLVGYEIGTEPRAFLDHFAPETLAMAARYGASIGLALYPPAMRESSFGRKGNERAPGDIRILSEPDEPAHMRF